jgi:hypothetical protein
MDVTQNHVRDSQLIIDMMQRLTGVNDSVMGVLGSEAADGDGSQNKFLFRGQQAEDAVRVHLLARVCPDDAEVDSDDAATV